LRFGHCVPVDFDLFTEEFLKREQLEEAFPFLGQSMVLQDEENSLSVITFSSQGSGERGKVSFLGIGFGRVGIPESTWDGML